MESLDSNNIEKEVKDEVITNDNLEISNQEPPTKDSTLTTKYQNFFF